MSLALLAGLCFGGFYAALAQGVPEAGLWPVLAAKVSGSLVAGVAVLLALRFGGLLPITSADPAVRGGRTCREST